MSTNSRRFQVAPGCFGKGRMLTNKVRSDARFTEGNDEHVLWEKNETDLKSLKENREKWEGHNVVMHMDMDAFFAAIEQIHHPELRGKPVIVGGLPGARGVVSTCSYEARTYGVKSAMSTAEAYRRCPDGIFIETGGKKYTYVSIQVLNIMKRFSPFVEPFSIDEAFLDVSKIWERYGSPETMAYAIKSEIKNETGLTCTIGISPNKIVAKMASGMDKPDGLTVICPAMMHASIDNLPVETIWGVGEATKKILNKMGVFTIGELACQDSKYLKRIFGINGPALKEVASGIDESKVVPYYSHPSEKSIGHETTLYKDTNSMDEVFANLRTLSERVGRRMRKSEYEARRITLKIRYSDFTTYTRARTLENHIQSDISIYYQTKLLFLENHECKKSVRLLGISVSKLREMNNHIQTEIFAEKSENRNIKVCDVMDKIKDNYGDKSITFSSSTSKIK
ncbi:MAG: DNA polymerase IV [candidate division Zixibacteria bacterium]|nr:DNA polymerase IV [candidate division Zixibacteria bacterium]